MKDTKLYYSPDPCGTGKTRWAITDMATRPRRIVYAIDRTEEFCVRAEWITQAAQNANTSPIIRSLSSKAGDIVSRDFPLTISDSNALDHVILIITHEALKLVDHQVVADAGWDLIVDEDPKLWSSATLDLGASAPFWEATYSLEEQCEGYSLISLKADAPTWRDVHHDVLTRPIAAFHNRVRRRNVVVNLSGADPWETLKSRQRLTYFTIWDVCELSAYRRVVFLANSFDRLVSFRLIKALYPDIEMEPISIGAKTDWVPRRLTINYVAEDHQAGSTFFSQNDQGKMAVKKWTDWVRGRVTGPDHYWTANKARGDLKLPGEWVSPKIAGSNAYRDRTQCSALYSAKASKAENAIFAELTGGLISAQDVRRDREFEDLIQVVFRSSLRMPDDNRSVEVNVYDRDQAEFLAGYFRDAGLPFETDLVFHDLGLSRVKAKPGPKPKPANPNRKTDAERARAYRARKAAARLEQADLRAAD